ncbi:MAG: hypothetical protein ACJAQ7_000500 [Sediminicola sp.]|jgi:hypothetical protein
MLQIKIPVVYITGILKVFKNTEASLAFFLAFSLLRIFECRGAGGSRTFLLKRLCIGVSRVYSFYTHRIGDFLTSQTDFSLQIIKN